MQKYFLFLYPVRAFVMNISGKYPNGYYILQTFSQQINTIITERYRKEGFRICWLFFNDSQNPEKPALAEADPIFELASEDLLLASGVIYTELLRQRYPDPDFILKHFPASCKLVLGGFHLCDCVDRIAERAHQKGLEVFVDEDATDGFFSRMKQFGSIPVQRNIRVYPETISELQKRLSPEKLANFLEASRQKPWLSQASA
jgi:hypothetical protein